MKAISHLPEPGFVVLEVTATDEQTAAIAAQTLSELWWSSGPSAPYRTPGEDGVRVRVTPTYAATRTAASCNKTAPRFLAGRRPVREEASDASASAPFLPLAATAILAAVPDRLGETVMDRTNGDRDSDQHEPGDIPDTGQPEAGSGHGDMGGGPPASDDDD